MRRCLIVDDSSVVRKIARHYLEQLGYEVSEAGDGKEALDWCKSKTPEAILLDWHLPVMGAHEFLVALRKLGGRRPYIVYLTTENDFADISLAISQGVSEVLMKPFDRQSLEEKFSSGPLAA